MDKETRYRLADTAYTAIIRNCLLSSKAQTDIPFGDLTLTVDAPSARRAFHELPDRKRVTTVFPDYGKFMLVKHNETMTLEEILLYDRLWEGEHHKTGYLGLPWATLVGDYGCKVSRRSFFEAKPWEIATSFARTLRHAAYQHGNATSNHPLRLLDVCTGSGVMAHALSVPTEGDMVVHATSLESNESIFGSTVGACVSGAYRRPSDDNRTSCTIW